MAQLYPPIISGTLPAFYLENGNLDRVIKITIPFTMNRAVSPKQVKGFALKIKTVQNSNYLYTALTYNDVNYQLEGSSYVTFVLKTSNNSEERELLLKTLKVGLFYKLQIAYIDQDDQIGNYSSVGISKFTTKPKVTIQNLSINKTNNHIFNYYGFYDQTDGDSTEKVYSYCFNLYDENDNIIATSGEKIHNTTMDIDLFQSYDEFIYNQDLDPFYIYKIQYCITTSNNLKLTSPIYRISSKITVDSDLKATIRATPNFDDGYIQIDLRGLMDGNGNEYITTGSFVLSRASEDQNYTNWEKLSTFKLIGEFPSRTLWKDFTAEQGKNYKYSIQQYNDQGLYSNRIYSNEVFSDFEDAFLYDGERQLKIRFNPKLGNVKTNLQETKVDTLGSKYPFFFRNGNVNYKEFTIAGLLSYTGDENFYFVNEDELKLTTELYRKETKSKDKIINDPTSVNIFNERFFKTKVLEWLNNGKPKLFRSPYEGNFIVRLMKVTLNPENKLGRLLHTFNGTAYEIDEYNYTNLQKYNFVTITESKDLQYLSWKTIKFLDKENGILKYPVNKVLNEYPTQSVKFTDMRPGQMIQLVFENDQTEIITIGITGSYSLDSKHIIEKISLLESNLRYQDQKEDQYLTGQMTYSFIGTTPNLFDKITMVDNISVPVQQFIGFHENIIQEIKSVKYMDSWVLNPKHELLKIFNIKCRKREIDDIYYNNGTYYFNNTDIVYDISKANQSNLMRIGTYVETARYNSFRNEIEFQPQLYKDLFNNIEYNIEEYDPCIYINGVQFNMEHMRDFNYVPEEEITSISCGNGAIVELTYYMKNTDFKIEDDDNYSDVYQAKQEYINKKDRLETYYHILGILGSFLGSQNDALVQFNNLKNQLDIDKAKEIQPYDNQLATLETNYNLISEQNEKAHLEMCEYIQNKMNELLVDGLSEDEQNYYHQCEEALWVEIYEYNKIMDKRALEYENQRNYLIGKKNQIEANYNSEEEYLEEQKTIQLETLAKQKEDILNLAKTLFGDNSWEDIQWVEELEQQLIKEKDEAYVYYIVGLVESQRIQAEEESINVQ